tara:strand:+ start:104 stop:1381 length:1278 start_codon:yes stop_codon:yes gene_type:complete
MSLPESTHNTGIVSPRIADVLERSDKMDPDQFFTAYSEVLSEILNSKLGRSPTHLRKAVVLGPTYEATGQQCWWRPDFSGFTNTKEPTYYWFRIRILGEGQGPPETAGIVKPISNVTEDDPIQDALLRLHPRCTTKNDIMSAGVPLPRPEIGDVIIVDLDQYPSIADVTYMGMISGAGSPGMGFPAGMIGMGFGGAQLVASKQAFVQGDPSKGTLGTTYEGLQGFTIMHPWGMQAVRRTSPFGMRTHPIQKTKKMHGGVDFAWRATPNAIMYACADGVVTHSKDKNPGSKSGGGYQVCLDMGTHPDAYGNSVKWTAWYVHMHPDTAAMAPDGKQFKEGEMLGIENNTGGSTGAHLHFGLYASGHPDAVGGKVDPEPFIDRLQPVGAVGGSMNFNDRLSGQTRLEDDLRLAEAKIKQLSEEIEREA